MQLRFRAGEIDRTVRIERSAGGYRVTAGERFLEVAVAGAVGPRLELIVDGRPVRAIVVAAGDRRFVKVGGADAVILERLPTRGSRARSVIPGEETLTAVMDGLVTLVVAKEGEVVPAGTPLVILEAMKMEIRVVAPFAGRVKRVACAPGDVVERGRVLVEMEPSV